MIETITEEKAKTVLRFKGIQDWIEINPNTHVLIYKIGSGYPKATQKFFIPENLRHLFEKYYVPIVE